MKVAMTEVKFYHIQTSPMDGVLPKLLEKIISKGHKVILKTDNTDQVKHFNNLLWTYHPDSFLPHGALSDSNPELQPIWITSGIENPNDADVLVLINGSTFKEISDFKLCCEVFDDSNSKLVEKARDNWRSYKKSGFNVSYWQQNSEGNWTNKSQD